MVGWAVSHYRVLELLGSGGRGTVCHSEDTRRGWRLAFKFLPADLARDRHALDRFQREAHAASALNHPHICTIYDIDEAGPSTGSGQAAPFIAMESSLNATPGRLSSLCGCLLTRHHLSALRKAEV